MRSELESKGRDSRLEAWQETILRGRERTKRTSTKTNIRPPKPNILVNLKDYEHESFASLKQKANTNAAWQSTALGMNVETFSLLGVIL